MKPFVTKTLLISFLLITKLTASSRRIGEELLGIPPPTSEASPFLVKASARLVDSVKGPLVEITELNAPRFTALVQATAARLKIPVPKVYLNFEPGWYNFSQGSITPGLSYIILSRSVAETASDERLMYGFLHECGHNALWHNTKLGLAALTTTTTLLYWLSMSKSSDTTKALITTTYVFGLYAFLMWYARINELEADFYASKNCANPESMLGILEKDFAETADVTPTAFLQWVRYCLENNHPSEKESLRAQITLLRKRIADEKSD